MSSAVDIQIVSSSNLEKIENFFKDSTYRETIEFSANFNTRLCIERRLRLPFLDPQTGVAQNHSNLFLNKRQRMPGFRQGQIYTYPAQRWRKSRRQYLNKMYRFPVRQFEELLTDHDAILASTGTASPIVGTAAPGSFLDPDFNGSLLEESSSLGAFGGDTSDSKDSQQQPQMQQQHQLQQHQHQQHNLKEDQLSKDWFYDDLDINDADSLEEPKSPADDEYDYDPRYGSKKRRKPRIGKRAMVIPGEGGTGRRRTGSGRGRANAVAIASSALSIADTSLTGSDVIDGGCGMLAMADASTPTTSGGKRSRGSRTRGRRRTKATSSTNRYPPGPNTEPPTFEMAAASVGVTSDFTCGSPDELSGLRNYRKYV